MLARYPTHWPTKPHISSVNCWNTSRGNNLATFSGPRRNPKTYPMTAASLTRLSLAIDHLLNKGKAYLRPWTTRVGWTAYINP